MNNILLFRFRRLLVFTGIGLFCAAPLTQRAHAIAGIASGNPALAIVGGVLMASGASALIGAHTGGGETSALTLAVLGYPTLVVGMILLPDESNAMRFQPLTATKVAALNLSPHDRRIPHYRQDRAKLDHIASAIQHRMGQLPASATDREALEASAAIWSDYRPTLRTGTWSLLEQIADKSLN